MLFQRAMFTCDFRECLNACDSYKCSTPNFYFFQLIIRKQPKERRSTNAECALRLRNTYGNPFHIAFLSESALIRRSAKGECIFSQK